MQFLVKVQPAVEKGKKSNTEVEDHELIACLEEIETKSQGNLINTKKTVFKINT